MNDGSTGTAGSSTGATDGAGLPRAVDRAVFQAELDSLRVREKAHTREGDAIAAARRRLPMVEVDANVEVIGPHGPQECTITRTADGPPAWTPMPMSMWPQGRPIAQWSRLEAGWSDDLGAGP